MLSFASLAGAAPMANFFTELKRGIYRVTAYADV
jgi:hypothetical protein